MSLTVTLILYILIFCLSLILSICNLKKNFLGCIDRSSNLFDNYNFHASSVVSCTVKRPRLIFVHTHAYENRTTWNCVHNRHSHWSRTACTKIKMDENFAGWKLIFPIYGTYCITGFFLMAANYFMISRKLKTQTLHAFFASIDDY